VVAFLCIEKNCFVNKRLSETKNWCIKTRNSLQKIEEIGRFWGVFERVLHRQKILVPKQKHRVQQQHSLKQKHERQGKNPILLRKLHRKTDRLGS